MPHASFDGLRVLSLETRRAREVEKLIRTYNGVPLVVPAMREVPLSSNTACLEFGRGLLRGEYDVVLFLTGVGVRTMMTTLETELDREAIVAALRRVQIVSRGVKPQSALTELGVPITLTVPEPATWREVLQALDRHYGEAAATLRLAMQEYGATNPELLTELVTRFDSVTKVPVYQWALPLDLAPLRQSVVDILEARVDVVLFMTAVQVIHLFLVAEEMARVPDLLRAFQSVVVISVGPTTTEELQHYGVKPDFEPSRPKMGFMINEAAQYSGKVLAAKRTPVDSTLVATALPARVGVQRVAATTSTMAGFSDGLAPLDILHDISSRIALADPLHMVLDRIVNFVSHVVPCDSCFVYTLEASKLVLRASKNPHLDKIDTFEISLGEGVTGWVAQHKEDVAISERASDDPRFKPYAMLPEDRFEAMLSTPILCANRVVGVFNVQHQQPYTHTELQRRLLSTLGILVGAEIERARLEMENQELTGRLESRKIVDRAKGILQRDMNLSEEEAYRTMQRESRQRRRTMRDIAEAILLAESLRQSATGAAQAGAQPGAVKEDFAS